MAMVGKGKWLMGKAVFVVMHRRVYQRHRRKVINWSEKLILYVHTQISSTSVFVQKKFYEGIHMYLSIVSVGSWIFCTMIFFYSLCILLRCSSCIPFMRMEAWPLQGHKSMWQVATGMAWHMNTVWWWSHMTAVLIFGLGKGPYQVAGCTTAHLPSSWTPLAGPEYSKDNQKWKFDRTYSLWRVQDRLCRIYCIKIWLSVVLIWRTSAHW